MFFEIIFVVFALASTGNAWIFWRWIHIHAKWKDEQIAISRAQIEVNSAQGELLKVASSDAVAALNRASTAFENISRIDRWDKHQDEELDLIKQRLAMLEEQ